MKTSSKKVLIIAPGRNARGGITSVICAYEETFIWQAWNCKWIETYADGSLISKLLYFLIGFLKFIINIWSSSIVHIHVSESTSAIRKSFFLYIAYFMKKKIILHFHAFSVDSTIYGKYKSLYRDMFKKSNVVIVLSEYWQNEIQHAFRKNSIQSIVLYNPCISITDKIYSISERKCYILYAGALNKRKGYCDLIEAFSRIAKNNPEWKLILAGHGEIKHGLAIAEKFKVSTQVIFKGWVTGHEKHLLFQQASIFCLPSYNEGFPMSLLDAWAYGTPVISTQVGGLNEVLLHRENSMLFKPGDVSTLAEHLNELIINKCLLKNLSEASLKLSQGSFNISTISAKLSGIYETICNST